jgi:DNA-binding winged helix-turn-helix (wHTH) protein
LGADVIRFGDYTLDATEGLRHGADEIRLTPRSLSVLLALAERAGRIVPKDELFRIVWRDTAVSDSALTSCVQELRHALQDDARRPRFIETLHRRGYRFVAATSAELIAERGEAVRRWPGADGVIVGRDAVVDDLLRAFSRAESGTRQICFVTGDAGAGKSTVVQACLNRLATRRDVAVTWGQGVERYGAGEPYQPLLDALMRLCRQPGGERFIAHLERYAPMWLAQLTGLLDPERQAALARAVSGATSDRMVRELTHAVEAIAARTPLVIAIEDLHWGDGSTLDWVSAFAQRPEAARVLLIATFRPSGIDQERSVRAVSDALLTRGRCSVIDLTPLNEDAIVEYVQRCFPSGDAGVSLTPLARRLHAHTGGNPLYVVNILADLIGRQLLARQHEGWAVRGEVARIDLGVSDDLRRTIERQIDRLATEDRELLEAGSVAGTTFPAAVVAAATGADAEAEHALSRLARQQQFLREAGLVEWPDGTTTTCFAFPHALYRDVIYRRIAAGRRVDLHRRIGDRLERAYSERAPQIAAELAMHFDHGRDARRVILYLQHAADNARRRHAFSEARAHFERALALLDARPASAERAEQEIAVRTGLGAVLMATHGFGSTDAEAAYSRVRTLCHAAGDTPRIFPALWGLWLFYWGRGAVGTAAELSADLMARATASGDEGLRLQAHHASWATAFSQGDLEGTCVAAAEGIRIYDADRHAGMAVTYGSHDVGVCARMFSARALVLLGRVDESLRVSDEAIVLATALDHPFSRGLALTFRAAVEQSRGDAAAARIHAEAGASIAQEQDFRLMVAWCSAIHGWAWAGSPEVGTATAAGTGPPGESWIAAISRAIAAARASGSDQFLPYMLGLHADACLRTGRLAAGQASIDDALATVERTGERFYEAELYRLRGELLFAAGVGHEHVEEALMRAIAVSRRQRADLLTLRATVSLGQLWNRLGKAAQAQRLVTESRAHFAADDRLRDVVEADAFVRRVCR